MVMLMSNPRPDLRRLASYVIAARIQAGYATRKEFAAATGITARTLGKLENATEPVSGETLARVAEAVHWTPDSPALVMAGREPVPAGTADRSAQPRPAIPGPPPSGSAVTPELLAAFKGDRTRALIWLAGENEGKDPAVDRADDLTQEIFRVLDNWRLGRRLRDEGTA